MSYFPISANVPYDRMGKQYNVTRVLNADNTFNSTAYLEYSPLYLPATYAMTYLLAFALSTCVIVHTLLYHGKSLVNGFKRIRTEGDDIHTKLMRNYPEVPDWWYATSFVLFFGLAILSMEVCSLLSVYGVILIQNRYGILAFPSTRSFSLYYFRSFISSRLDSSTL